MVISLRLNVIVREVRMNAWGILVSLCALGSVHSQSHSSYNPQSYIAPGGAYRYIIDTPQTYYSVETNDGREVSGNLAYTNDAGYKINWNYNTATSRYDDEEEEEVRKPENPYSMFNVGWRSRQGTTRRRQDETRYRQDTTRHRQDDTRYRQDTTRHRQDDTRYRQDTTRHRQDDTRYSEDDTRHRQDNTGRFQQDTYAEEPFPEELPVQLADVPVENATQPPQGTEEASMVVEERRYGERKTPRGPRIRVMKRVYRRKRM